MLCEYLNIEYETTEYEVDVLPDGSYSRQKWFDVKFTLGMDFPNLPYLMDDENNVKISESMAIMKYLCRKAGYKGMAGVDDIALAGKAEMLEGPVNEIRNQFLGVCYMGASPENWFLENAPGKYKVINDFMGPTKKFLITENEPTYLDFFLWEITDHQVMYKPDFLDGQELTNIKNWYQNFAEIPAVKKYLEANEHRKWPINNKMAWGGGNGPSELYKFEKVSGKM